MQRYLGRSTYQIFFYFSIFNSTAHSLKKRIVSDEEFVKQKQSQLKAKLDSIAQQKAQARAQAMANEVKAAEISKANAETLVKKAAEVREVMSWESNSMFVNSRAFVVQESKKLKGDVEALNSENKNLKEQIKKVSARFVCYVLYRYVCM